MTRNANFLRFRSLALGIAVVMTLVFAGASSALAKGPKGKKGWGHHGHVHYGQKAPVVTVVHQAPIGTLRIHNPTSFRFGLVVDGNHVGKVAPGSSLVLANLDAGKHRIRARILGMPNGPNQRLAAFVKPHQTTSVSLAAPVASLKVRNKQPVAVSLHIDGHSRTMLAPGATARIDGLLAGNHRVELVGPTGLIAGRQMHLEPGGHHKWAPPAALGTVTVRNGAPRAVTVSLSNGATAHVAPGGKATFRALPTGTQSVTVTGKHGRSVSTRLTVRANRTTHWTFVPPHPHKAPAGYGAAQVAWID